MKGVTDEGRLHKAQVVDAVKGLDDASVIAEQGIADDENQPALHHALAELALFGELGIRMNVEPVAGQAAEVDDVGLGDGAPAGPGALTQREFVKRQIEHDYKYSVKTQKFDPILGFHFVL